MTLAQKLAREALPCRANQVFGSYHKCEEGVLPEHRTMVFVDCPRCRCCPAVEAAIEKAIEACAWVACDYDGKGMLSGYDYQLGDAQKTRADIEHAIRSLLTDPSAEEGT